MSDTIDNGGTEMFVGTRAQCESVAALYPRMLTLVDDTNEKSILVQFPSGVKRAIVLGTGVDVFCPDGVEGGVDRPKYNGRQDNFLANADKNYTVTLSGEVGGYTSATLFDERPDQFTSFTGDGTFKSVTINLGGSKKVAAIGIVCPTATAPTAVKISVYYGGGWVEIYNTTTVLNIHLATTGSYGADVSQIKIEASKSTNFSISEIFGHSGTLVGQTFLQTNGQVNMEADIVFGTNAVGKGLSLKDATTTARYRVYMDNGVLQAADAAIGYTAGQGGTVTQSTSKATGVTLNTRSGTITLNNAALAANTTVSFTFTNSKIAANDTVLITHVGTGALGSYNFAVAPGAGTATIYVRNVSAGSLSEAIVLRFAVIKGAVA